MQEKRLARLGKAVFVLPYKAVEETQIAYGLIFSRIDLLPLFIHLSGFFHIAQHKIEVIRNDVKFFSLAYVLAQFVGLCNQFRTTASFAKILITGPEQSVGHGKFGVELNGSLEKWDGCFIAFFIFCSIPRAVSLQRLERVRGGLLYRCVVLLDRTKRFT